MAVLIADDYAPVRTSLLALVESLGYEVLEAEDGEEALRIIADGGIDVLLLDLYMPRCDGIGVLEQLEPSGPKVIVVSAFQYISEGDLLQRFGNRITAILKKPVHPQTLLRYVESAVSSPPPPANGAGAGRAPLNRVEVVRAGYERFNDKDFEGTLRFFDEDAELYDAFLPGDIVRGKPAIFRLWQGRFGTAASVGAVLGDMFESGDDVVAVVSYQAYDPSAAHVGDPVIVVQRFTFRGDRVVRMESRILDEIPPQLKDMFLAAS